MASHYDVCHNWAHQLKAHLTGDRMRFEWTKIYSYSTVIGQIIPLKNGKTIYLLNDKTYSSSTSKHQSYMRSAIPSDAEIFSLTPPTGRFVYGWSGAWVEDREPGCEWWRSYISSFCFGIIEELKEFATSKSTKNENECKVFSTFQSICRFCDVTEYTTIKKLIALPYDKWRCNYAQRKELPLVRKVLVMLNAKASLAELVDVVNGKGTYQAYVDRTSGARKMANARKWNAFLGYRNCGRCGCFYRPYRWRREPKHQDVYLQHNIDEQILDGGITSQEIEKLRKAGTFIDFLRDVRREHLEAAEKKYELHRLSSRRSNAMSRLSKYVGIVPLQLNRYTVSQHFQCSWNGETLNLDALQLSVYIHGSELPQISQQEYANFRVLSANEQQSWINAKREAVFHTYQKLLKLDVRRRAEAEERMRQYEIEMAEKQLRYEADKKRLEELKSEGDEGIRKAYHEGLLNTVSFYGMDSSLFFGGNVLMRYDSVHNEVVTSKGMRIVIEEAQRLWKLVCKWHDNKSSFQLGESARTYGYRDGWRISSYSNDIMVAGCHSIAYPEMKYIADTLGFASA